VVSGQWSVNASRNTLLWFGHTWNLENRAEDFVSRYRRGWGAGVMGDWPDSALDTPGSAASTRAGGHWADTSLKLCAASVTIDITITNWIIA